MPHSEPGFGNLSERPAAAFAKYILMFAAFGLFGLAIISTKYERRQAKIEQQFHGIQQMQQGTGGEGAGQSAAATPDQRPLIITLRPLMIVVGIITLVAWMAVVLLNRQPPGAAA